mgnify:CR=1 FL=1
MTAEKLAGKAAIVTGGAQGIGGGIARQLAADGGHTIQLQENIVMDLKDYIVENPDLRTYFDRPDTGAPRR